MTHLRLSVKNGAERLSDNDSLLLAFVNRKLTSHEEPQRKGTPRGEPIGLSSRKLLAAMLSGLTNFPLRDVAQKARCSYGLLRKWTCEDVFKKVQQELISEHAEEVIAYVRRQVENWDRKERLFQSGKFPDRPGRVDVPAIKHDQKIWSDTFLNRMLETVFRPEFIENTEDSYGWQVAFIFHRMDLGPRWKKPWIRIYDFCMAQAAVEHVAKILQKRQMSQKDRRQAVELIEVLAGFIKEEIALLEEESSADTAAQLLERDAGPSE